MCKILFLALTLLLTCAVQAADVSGLQTFLTESATAWKHSDYPTALKKLEQGLKLARQLKHQQAISTFISNLGVVYNDLGQYAKALEYYEQALVIRRKIGDRKGVGNNLTNIGVVYKNLGQYAKALEYYEQALLIKREIGDRKGEGNNLTNIGVVYKNLGQYAKALEYYEQALLIKREIGDRKGVGNNLTNIGVVYDDLGQYAKALETYEQALVIGREIGNRKGVGGNLTNIGVVYQNLGQYAKALEYHEQALAIRREIGDRKGEGADLTNIGVVYQSLGQYAKALEYCEQALVIYREIGDRKGEGADLTNIGLVYKDLGQYAKALEYYEQALVIKRGIGDRKEVSDNLGNIGVVYDNLGQYAKALEQYEQTLAIKREIGDRKGEGAGLTNIGVVYWHLGQYAKALETYEQALLIKHEIGDRQGVGVDLANIGLVYQELGQYAKALEYYEQALAIKREIGDRKGEGADLSNIGVVYGNLGQYAKALEYEEQALAIRREIGNRKGEGANLTNIGVVYQKLGQYAKALETYEQALLIKREIGDRTGEGSDLNNIAVVHESRGDYSKARDSYQQALALWTQTGEPENLWMVWKNLYEVTEKLKNPNAAIFYGKQAVNTIQSLRANVAKLDDKTLSQSFLKNKKHIYQGLADLLMRQGRLFEAQKVLDMLKEEEYFDFIRRTRAFEISDDALRYTPPEQPWADRYAEISAQLVNLGQAYSLLKTKKRRGAALTRQETRRLRTLRKNLEIAERALQAWFKEMQLAFANLKQEDLQAMLDAFADEQQHTQQLLQRLGKGTVLLHYVPMPDTLHILATTPNLTLRRESAVKREELGKAVLALREALKQAGRKRGWNAGPQTDPAPLNISAVQQAARSLHDWLIQPIAEDLRRAKAQVLMVYLYGEMRYLPLAALHDGKHWLAEKYALAIYAAAADKHLDKARLPDWKVAGLGVSVQHGGFAPLPAVKTELESIVRRNSADKDGVLPGEIHLDAAFTESRLFDVLERDFPVLHIASHFNLNVGKDIDSFLLLGDGSRLTLADIGVKPFAWDGLDMLTLSACNTGMGLHGTGVEIEGLGTLVVKRGARSVLATLWQVSDQSTADFMRLLYAGQVAGPISKAKAIQSVQQAFIRAEKSNLPGYYAHPFHWAPFILMGNWL
ncbi:MAG: tetratricopeptide repeat protein [Gammaproteobacteria bacterium]|nr:tetratricopeptide repeat protein [Gammaproteobacteria bacterium]